MIRIKGCWYFAAGWIWVTKKEQNTENPESQGAAHAISVQGPWVSPGWPHTSPLNYFWKSENFSIWASKPAWQAACRFSRWGVRRGKRNSPELFHSPPSKDCQRGLWAAADGQSEAALSKSTSYSALHILYYYSDTSKNTIVKLHNLIWNYSLFCHRRRRKKKRRKEEETDATDMFEKTWSVLIAHCICKACPQAGCAGMNLESQGTWSG